MEVPSRDEIQRIEDVAETERDKLIVRLLADIGVRVGELVKLRTSDFVERDRSVYLHVQGKGARERLAPLSPALARRLRRYTERSRPADANGDRLFLARRRSVSGEHEPITEILTSGGLRFARRRDNMVSIDLSRLGAAAGHIAEAGAIVVAAAIATFLAGRVVVQFRGLLMPLFPGQSAGRFRTVLQIHSYLPRWRSAGTLAAAWLGGVAMAYGAIRSLNVVGGVAQSVGSGLAYVLITGYAGGMWVVYGSLRDREQRRIQLLRDARARRVVDEVSVGSSSVRLYSVWLRPFVSTGRVWVVARSRYVKLRSEDVAEGGYHVDYGDLETLLAELMEPVAPMIALGAGGEQVGAGRVTTPESSWHDMFTLLAARAHTIFLLPSLRQGTWWELNWLKRQLSALERSIFVLPPAYPFDPFETRIRAEFNEPGARTPGVRGRLFHDATREIDEVRSEALKAFKHVLNSSQYAKLADIDEGALVRLGGEGSSEIVDCRRLKMSTWYPAYWSGPRFLKSRLRAVVRDMAWDR